MATLLGHTTQYMQDENGTEKVQVEHHPPSDNSGSGGGGVQEFLKEGGLEEFSN